LIFFPIWALTAIANILEFTGRKIAANNKRERIKKERLKRAEKKRLKALAQEQARYDEFQADNLAKTKAEFERVAKSKRVEKDMKARLAALEVPITDDKPYGGTAPEEKPE